MRLWLVLSVLFVSLSTSNVHSQPGIPYLYRFFSEERAFVIERADGSDQQRITPEYHDCNTVYAVGPGWSPDGRWFAWSFVSYGDGFPTGSCAGARNVHTGMELEAVQRFDSVWNMYWSPNSDLLLVDGFWMRCQVEFICRSYWLVDVAEDWARASLDLIIEVPGDSTPVEWLPDGEGVVFYASDALGPHVRIELRTDGTAIKQRPAPGELDAVTTPQPTEVLYPEDELYPSPSGRYVIRGDNRTLMDTVEQTTVILPAIEQLNSSRISGAKWHDSEEWVILAYRPLDGDTRASAVYNVITQEFHFLSWCGFDDACVGWLPDNVDVESIPLLADTP